MNPKIMNENNFFSDLEGLRIAIDMEERGRDFYQKAHDLTENPDYKALFKSLAAEEAVHLEKFTQIYNEVKEKKCAGEADYLFDDNISKYLTSLTDQCIFNDSKAAEINLGGLSVVEILKKAIQDEKDAVLFYDALAKNSKFEDAKKIFSALKAEEQTHIVKLHKMIVDLG